MAEQKKVFTIEEIMGQPATQPSPLVEETDSAPQQVFTIEEIMGQPKVCPDGTVVGENEECPEQGERGIPANLSRSLVGAGRGLADLPDTIDLQFDTFRVNQLPKKLDIYKAIDEGADPRELYREANKDAKVFGPTELGDFVTYQEADADKRARLKGNIETTVTESRADILETLPELERRQQETSEKYGPRVEGITDIRSLGDFRDWLTYSIGSGAVQLAPVMASAMIAGPVGAVTTGTALAGSETVNNRLDFIRGITKDLSAEDQAQAISDYLNATKDTSTITALVSGALDMAGPVGGILKRKLAKEVGQELTEFTSAEAAKQFGREALEEGLTGGAQEITQIAGQRSLGEQEGDVFSTENIKRVIDSAAAEAAGSTAGSAFNVGTRAYAQSRDSKRVREAQEKISNMDVPQEISVAIEKRTIELLADDPNLNSENAKDVQTALTMATTEYMESGELFADLNETELDLSDDQKLNITEVAEQVIKSEATPDTISNFSSYIGSKESGLGGQDGETFYQQELTRLRNAEQTQPAQEGQPDQQDPEFGKGIDVKNTDPEFGAGINVENTDPDLEARQSKNEVVLKPKGKPGRRPQPPRTPEEQARVDQNIKDQKNRSRSAARINTRLNKILNANPQQIIERGIKLSKTRTGINTYQEYDELKSRVAELTEIRDAGMFTDPERGETAAELNKEFNEKKTTLNDIENTVEAENDRNKADRIDALADAYEITLNPAYQGNKKALARAQGFIDGDAFTDLEKKDARAARIKKQVELQKPAQSTPISEYVEEEVNPVLTDPNVTLESALDSVVKGGKKFESFVARRLRPFIKDTKLQIIPTDLGAVDPQIAGEFVTGAAGVYFDDTNTIFLSSRNDGLNNLTLLHEAVHAATMNLLARSINDPSSVPERVNRLRQEILDQMDEAAMKYAIDKANGRTTPEIDKLAEELDIFTDLMEFVAYGITQPEFQEFLMTVEPTLGYIQDIQKNGLSGLVNVVRRLFGFGDNTLNGFITLLDTTDQLLRAGRPTKRVPTNTIAAAKKVANKTTAMAEKLRKSRNFEDTVNNMAKVVWASRNGDTARDFAKSVAEAGDTKLARVLVKAYTTEGITRTLTNDYDMQGPKQVNKVVVDIQVARNLRIRDLAKQIPEWEKFNGTFPEAAEILADIMHMTTLYNFDPAKHVNLQTALQNDQQLKDLRNTYASMRSANVSVAVVNAAKGAVTGRENRIREIYEGTVASDGKTYGGWDRMQQSKNWKGKPAGARGVKLYKMARDSYEKTFDEHQNLLVAKIEKAEVNDPEGEKNKKELLAKITANYQRAKKMEVYFPLMRYGDFFLRVGKGRSREYYLFESESARNYFARQLAKQTGNRTYEQLIEDQEMSVGTRGQETIRKEIRSSSQILKDVFDLIEKTNGLPDTEQLKDQVYQMYLMTLPEADIRKRFSHRKGITGFSGDVLRNFIVSQSTSANQLARLEYSDELRGAVAGMEAELVGNPNASKIAPYVREMSGRALEESNPTADDSFFSSVAGLGTSFVFYWLLSAPKSALIQFTQLPISGLPVLSREFGGARASATMARYTTRLPILFGVGDTITNDAGEQEFTINAPSIRLGKYLENIKDADLKQAMIEGFEYAEERELFMSTYAAEQTSRARKTSKGYASGLSKGTRFAAKAGSFMFHHMERMNREIMYMSSLELAYADAKKKGLSAEEASAQAKERALELSYEGLFNYTNYNKPTLMKSGVGRVWTQFMTYAMQMSSLLVRNFLRGVLNAKVMGMSKTDRKDALGVFTGVLGMVGLFGGTLALPLLSQISFVIDNSKDLIKELFDGDEEELEDLQSLTNMPFELWFTSVFIPKHFGLTGDLAGFMGMSQEQSELAARGFLYGPISAYTNYNVGSSMRLDGMFFRDVDMPRENYEAWWQDFLYSTGTGPFGSVAGNMLRGVEDIENGEWQRGIENMLPAALRNVAKAFRLHQEGLVTRDGLELRPPEYYTPAKLLAQGLGFGDTEAAAQQEFNYMVTTMLRNQNTERTKVLEALNRASLNYEKSNTEKNYKALLETMKLVTEYNIKNYDNTIGSDTIRDSLGASAERRGANIEGLYLRENQKGRVLPLIYKEFLYD